MSEANRGRVQQIVAECFVKAAHVILSSRIYNSSRTVSKQGPKCWFNLENEEAECAQREMELWRRDPSCPMIIEIYLQPWAANEAAALSGPTPQADAGAAGRRLLERWVLSYAPASPADAKAGAGRPMTSRLEPAAIYKRMVISLRSLFSYVRVLPAYRLFRACAQQQAAQERGGISLQYRVSRGMPGTTGAGRGPPVPRLDHFVFTPIETPHGLFRMSVDFAPSSTVTILKETTSPGPVAQIIQDYASSGSAARRTPQMAASMHVTRGSKQQFPHPPSSSPMSAGAGILRAAPASMQQQQQPMLRRHSWSTHGLRNALNAMQQPAGGVQASPSLPATPLSGTEAARHALAAPGTSPSPSPHERGGYLNRLATHSEADEALAAAGPSQGHAWMTPPKHPGTPTSPHYSGPLLSGAVRTWSRAAANEEALLAKTRQREAQERVLQQQMNSGQPALAHPLEQEAAGREAGGGTRQTSAPVCIPGASEGTHRSRIHSSGDLAALQRPNASPRPLKTVRWTNCPTKAPASAPAASAAVSMDEPPHLQETSMHLFNARTTGFNIPVQLDRAASGASGRLLQPNVQSNYTKPNELLKDSSGASASGVSGRRPSYGSGGSAQPPPTPPAQGGLGGGPGSESSGSAASSFPASCSPQLPFAFTPSALSLSSLHDQPGQSGGWHGGGGMAASPAAVGPGALTVFRRPSIGASPRSSAFDLPPPGALGYSLSPVQGSLESSLMGASTPRYTSGLPLVPPSSYASPLLPTTRGVGASGGSFSSAVGPPRLTYPGSGSGDPAELAALPSDEAEADVLPFALDADAVPASPHPPVPLRMSLGGTPSPPELDEEVGAFVRAIQEAPPSLARGAAAAPLGPVAHEQLQYGGAPSRLTLQAGLDQLSRFKARVEAM
ncbi:g3521 [Coccomyxa elongata]